MDGDTALSRACYHNKYVFVSYLLRKGARVNVHGIRGNTPLHISVSSCSVQTIKDLIAHGACVDALNDNHETALHIACRMKRFEVLKVLVEHARHVDVLTLSNSKTPLFTLIENIDVDCIEMAIYLIKAGADVEKLKEPTKRLSRFANLIQILNQSPFFYIFKIKKAKFIFHQQQSKHLKAKSNIKFMRRDLVYDIDSPTSSLRTYLILIELVIKAGYQPKQMDYQFFRNSWLYNYTNKYDIELKRSLENLFLMNGLNSPRSLIDQCRIRMRLLLAKPIRKSIDSLCIPNLLKNFLQFE
jgi:ankyrin repeat protein